MIYLKELVKLDALDKVAMTDTPHDGNDVDRQTTITDLEMVGNERIIFVSNRKHLFIWADVKAQRLSVVITRLVCKGHLDRLQIEESDVVIVASSDQEQYLLVTSAFWLVGPVGILDTPGVHGTQLLGRLI